MHRISQYFTGLVLAAASLATVPPLQADVTPAALFCDHVVLQQDKPVPVWGHAAPGERVTVGFRDQKISTVTPSDGRWIVYLDPLATGPAGELVIEGANTLRIQDVLVGEVWLCAGQNNMEMSVDQAANASAEIFSAMFPQIRHFRVAPCSAETPAPTASGAWQVCSAETVRQFSAVGYFFARDIHRRTNLPIGIINCAVAGSTIEAWMSEAMLKSEPAFATVDARWSTLLAEYPTKKAAFENAIHLWEQEQAAARASKKPQISPRPREPFTPGGHATPRGLFNGMIAPLQPCALRGVLWYQGESNIGRDGEYRALFPTLISTWRRHWGQGDFPFLFVQLANYRDTSGALAASLPAFREAQTAALSLPETGMAVAIDLGNAKDITPPNKQDIGRRLALIARHMVYGIPGDWAGPLFQSARRENASVRVWFRNSEVGLISYNKPPAAFELAGPDGRYHPADAAIDRGTVILNATEVPNPVSVRYAWRDNPDANLYSGAGLPAAPFQVSIPAPVPEPSNNQVSQSSALAPASQNHASPM